jgi:hypothetical protein
MNQTLNRLHGIANAVGAALFTARGTPEHLHASVMQVVRALWPRKTVPALCDVGETSERGAKYYLAERRMISAICLARLIRSDDGLHFLIAVMGDAQPAWWRGLKAQARIADVRRTERELRKQLREATAYAEEAMAGIARAETALSIQDPDFAGEQFAPHHQPGGALHRAVADGIGQPKGRNVRR